MAATRKVKPQAVPKPESHALLSASSAHRWLNCPPSARLEEGLPDSNSFSSREGTIAHELAALKLEQHFNPQKAAKGYTTAANKILKSMDELYVAEQPNDAIGLRTHGGVESAVNEYIDLVKDTVSEFEGVPFVAIEQRVDYSDIAPEGFGTSDCILIGRTLDCSQTGGLPAHWTLHIIDYKHGKGVAVSAQDNPQLRLYALGALRLFAAIYPIETVTMTICQPRLNNITHSQMSVVELERWGQMCKPIAFQAYEGEGEYKEGTWCRFCRAGVRCAARAKALTALEDFGYGLPEPSPKGVPLLNDEELGYTLTVGVRLVHWVDQLKAYTEKRLLEGGSLPGWKLVNGRSVRAFTDRDQAFEVAKQNGVKAEMLYKSVPVALTELETLMGKKNFETTMAEQVIRKPGKPTLALESDPRPAWVAHTAAEDFGEQPEPGDQVNDEQSEPSTQTNNGAILPL